MASAKNEAFMGFFYLEGRGEGGRVAGTFHEGKYKCSWGRLLQNDFF